MITLVSPSPGNSYIFKHLGWIFGPFGPDFQNVEVVTSYLSDIGEMQEAKGVHGENNVRHVKCDGYITFIPSAADAIHAPLCEFYCYPDRVSCPSWLGGLLARDLIANCGFACHGASSHYYIPSSNLHYHSFVEVDPSSPSFGTVWMLQGFAGQPSDAYRYDLGPITSRSSTYMTFRQKRTAWSIPETGSKRVPMDLTGSITLDQAKAYIEQFDVSSTTTSTINSQWSTLRNVAGPPICSPRSVREALDIFFINQTHHEYEFDEPSYGDLAMQASEKINATRINMLAFLRDLKNPKAMIPKLSNLLKLKTHANNYLAVQYGILPTIDDIQSIMGAFSRISPYLDKNGFETYSSSWYDSLVVDEQFHQIERHIKLAIDNEDSDFKALTNRFESFGMLPTFKNIWDLIPYSFVIDWLIDVGDFLRRIDTRLRLMRLNVQYATYSRKYTTDKWYTWSHAFPYAGHVSFGRYYRLVSDQCPTPSTSLHHNFDGFDHWIESAALLIQRKR